MGLLDNESIPRRKMILFFVIDTSGSMIGKKIGSVNDAIENVLPMIGEISDENPDAEINVAALEFSTGTRWLYDEPKEAKDNSWFKHAIKIAIAIGDDADKEVLKQFTGSSEAVITVHNIEALKKMIRIIAVTSSQIGSQSSSAIDSTKQQQVIDKVNEAAADVAGAETAASPAPAGTDSYDEWD